MTFSECTIFCKKNEHLIGTKAPSGKIITNIISAPDDMSIFHEYLKYAIRDSIQSAIVRTGAHNFSPLLFLEAPEPYLYYSWYFVEFPLSSQEL